MKNIEVVSYIIYLTVIILLGIIVLKESKGQGKSFRLGMMILMLVVAESFQLVPRIISMTTTGSMQASMDWDLGKSITSIFMAFFYFMLYWVWEKQYHVKDSINLTIAISILTGLAIPNTRAKAIWQDYRNIPFIILGIVLMILFHQKACREKDNFQWMSLAVLLSLIFYSCIILLGNNSPGIGGWIMMKNVMHLWIVFMGYKEVR